MMRKTRSVWKVIAVALAISAGATIALAVLTELLGGGIIFLAACSLVLVGGFWVVILQLVRTSKSPDMRVYPHQDFNEKPGEIKYPRGPMSVDEYREKYERRRDDA